MNNSFGSSVVEQLAFNQLVEGSSPSRSTTFLMRHFILPLLCALALTACDDRLMSDFHYMQAVREKYKTVTHLPGSRWYYAAIKEDGSVWCVATGNLPEDGYISEEIQLFSAEEIKRVVNSDSSVK